MTRKLSNKEMAASAPGSRHTASEQIHAIKMDVPGTRRNRYQTLGPPLHCQRKTRASVSWLASGNRSATSVSLLSSKYNIHMSALAKAGPHMESEEAWEMGALVLSSSMAIYLSVHHT